MTAGTGGWGSGVERSRRERRAGGSAVRAVARVRGFSLLELAIALALITIAAIVAIPSFYARPGVTLDSAAILLAKDLRHAQNLAAQRGIEVVLEFSPDGTGYRVIDAEGRAVQNPLGAGALIRDYARDGVFEGVRIESVQLGARASASYDARGLSLQGGSIRLGDRGARRTLSLQAGSGLIDIEGLSRPWSDSGQ